MKYFLVLFAFIFIANFVYADCFIDGSSYFLILKQDKIKEILSLTANETSESELYKEVVSDIKERFSIDIDKDINQITIYSFTDTDSIFVINGTFDTEIIQNKIKSLSESEKWRFHQFADFELGGNKYLALRINENNNFIFYDKNTLIFCRESAEKNNSIKISETPDSVNNIKKVYNNFLFITKNEISLLKYLGKTIDLDLNKANYTLLYLKDNQLCLEADFKDSSLASEAINKINNLLIQEQKEKLNQNIKSFLERTKNETYKYNKDLPNILLFLFDSTYSYCKSDLFSYLKISQSENIVKITCDFDIILPIVTTIAYPGFFFPETKNLLNKIRQKSSTRIPRTNYSEIFKTLYDDNLQKEIDELKIKIKSCNFVDVTRFGIILYFHSKARKTIDLINNSLSKDENTDSLKNKYNIGNLFKFINFIYYSFSICAENEDSEYIDFAALQDKKHQKECFKIQQAFDMYNMDNSEIMTYPDIPLLVKKHYLKEEDVLNNKCEYYAVGDISKDGYISCKTHGSYQNRKPTQTNSNLNEQIPSEPIPTQPKVFYQHTPNKNYQKECFQIQQAFDLYNMDNAEIMNYPNISLLLEKHYLKDTKLLNIKCEYYTVGDLNNNGYIACKTHGNYLRPQKPTPGKIFYHNLPGNTK